MGAALMSVSSGPRIVTCSSAGRMKFRGRGMMRAYDADAHVEESPETFSDAYFDPEYRDRRPRVIELPGQGPVWVIDEKVFPRRTGRGAHHFSTPAAMGEIPSALSATKRDELGSITLADVRARIRQMDAENIDRQVIYPTLFLAYPLTDDPVLGSALCCSYNRWIAQVCSQTPA